MALQVDKRPQTLDDIIGNEITVKSLKKLLQRKKGKPTAFLFTGNSGCGKTTFARIVAKELGAHGVDFHEMNSSSFRGIDTIRDIQKQAKHMSFNSKSTAKVFFFDECHKLTADAQEAILKLAEEPPKQVFLILATTNPEKLTVALKRRCTDYVVKPVTSKSIRLYIRKVAKSIPKNARKLIAEKSDGSLGIALKYADKIMDLDKEDMLEAIQQVELEIQEGIALCRVLLKATKFKAVSEVLKTLEGDPESIRYQVLGYFNSVLLGNGNAKAFKIMEAFSEPFYNTGKAGLTMACYEAMYSG